MRLKIMTVATTVKQINKARLTGKLSLVAAAKLDMLEYYLNFAKEMIDLGHDTYKDKYKQLNDRINSFVLSCPDIICNIRQSTCASDNYEQVEGTIKNPYNPQLPSTPIDPEPEPINLPPIIGDQSIIVDRNVTTILSLEMFTSQTAPPYSDPENDLIDAIRVDKIHTTNLGIFYVSGIPITVGQIITREQLAAGLMTHIGADIDTITSDSFDFSARDEGSGIWVQ